MTLTPNGAEYGEAPDDDFEPRTSIVPEADQRFGRYRLCFELASGGMGKVYLARMEGPGGFEKFAAVKRIHSHLAERTGFVHMFLDEARITSRIDHPNVCSVLDFGQAGGSYYIAMEYLFGEPLSRVLSASFRMERDDPRRVRFSARILAQACEGLHAAHDLRGDDGQLLEVVHRDVSPHNIFVTYDGGVRVVDFGIARASDQLHETTTGSVKGKWAYMSPEQAKGQLVDRRADVWSLGVVLWEAASGRRLFRRDTQTETVLAVVGLEVQPPSAINPNVPPEIDEIAMRALSRDPEQRWRSARAMGQALSHFLAGMGTPVGMVEVGEWMDECFPGAAARKRDLLATAREGSYPGGAHDEFPEQSAVRLTMSVDAPTIDEGERAPFEPTGASAAEAAAEPRRRGRWSIALAALVFAATVPAMIVLQDVWLPWIDGEAAPPPPSPSPRGGEIEPIATDPPRGVEPNTPPSESPRDSISVPAPDPVTEPAPEPAQPRRRRARRRAQPAPTGTGHVFVVTTGGWGLVYEGSRNLGETPASLTLPVGEHVLEIRPFGQTPGIRRVVQVEVDGRHRVAVPVSR